MALVPALPDVIVVIGAVVVVGSSMVTGLRIERWIEPYIPWWPGDIGVVAGPVVGAAFVAGWLLNLLLGVTGFGRQ